MHKKSICKAAWLHWDHKSKILFLVTNRGSSRQLVEVGRKGVYLIKEVRQTCWGREINES